MPHNSSLSSSRNSDMTSSPISQREIKYLKALSQKKFRDEEKVFTVEGEKMVSEALASGFEVLKVFRTEEIGEEAMGRISSLSSPSPVLALVRQPEGLHLSDRAGIEREVGSRGLFLALDTIRDPGNLGTILRIADWFGIDAVFAAEDTVECFNPKVVQATMGAIFRVRFHYCSLPALSEAVKARGGHIYGTFLDGENIYSKPLETGSDSPAVIVIGNESNGISPKMAAEVTDRLFIPPYPEGAHTSESLNAAVATAITISEFRRRC